MPRHGASSDTRTGGRLLLVAVVVAAMLAGGQPPPAVHANPGYGAASQSCGDPILNLPFPGHYNVVVNPATWTDSGPPRATISVAEQTFSIEVTDASISFGKVKLIDVMTFAESTSTGTATFTKPRFTPASLGGGNVDATLKQTSVSSDGGRGWGPAVSNAFLGFSGKNGVVTCTSISGEVAGLSPQGQRITFTATPDGATQAAYEKAMDAVRARAAAADRLSFLKRAPAFVDIANEIEAAKRPVWECEFDLLTAAAFESLNAQMTALRDELMTIAQASSPSVLDRYDQFKLRVAAFVVEDQTLEYFHLKNDCYEKSDTMFRSRAKELIDPCTVMLKAIYREGGIEEPMELDQSATELGLSDVHDVAVSAAGESADATFARMVSAWPNASSKEREGLLVEAAALDNWAVVLGARQSGRAVEWACSHGAVCKLKSGSPWP